jgi:hypothetical protein
MTRDDRVLSTFRLNGQTAEIMILQRSNTNIHDSHNSCLLIWMTHLAVRRDKFMLIPAGQFIGDRLLIFRGDKDISVLLHPAVFSPRPNLVSIVAPLEYDLLSLFAPYRSGYLG